MQRLLAVLCALAVPVANAQLVDDLIHETVGVGLVHTETTDKTVQLTFASQSITAPFTGMALQGFAAGDSLVGYVRFGDEGTWGAWLELYIVRSATDEAFLASYRGEDLRESTRMELKFLTEAGQSVQILRAGTFDTRLDGPDPGNYRNVPHEADDFVIIAPQLYRRRDWNAEPFRGIPIPLSRPSYDFMTLHHTAGFSATTLAQGLEQTRRIQDFHQNGRGWSDIGYQFLMDQEGRLYQGRPFMNESAPWDQGPPLAHGAHVGGANTGNIGVSLMGCYHPPEGSSCLDEMTQPTADSLVANFGFLSERYGVSPDRMRGHRDFSQTSCPGDNNYAQLPSFRKQVADLLAVGNAPLGTAALDARTDSLGVVFLRWAFQSDLGVKEYEIQRRSGESITTLVTRDVVEDGQIVDLGTSGEHEYSLVARGSYGRVQVLASVTISIPTPKEYVLAQSYPNPAADRATVRYFLRQPGIVRLEVFDVAGRRITTVEENYKDEGIWHTATVDLRTWSSGVYYYQIQVEGFVSTEFQSTQPIIILR